MAGLIAEAVKNPAQGEHVCKHCGKTFLKESTLVAHPCEPKRRYMQRDEVGVRLGLQAWLRFYEITQGSSNGKTYVEFSRSNLYLAFVKFGRHCHGIGAINVGQFIDYVIKGNFKLDHWCKDAIYDKYLYNLLRTEASVDAMERGIKTMEAWAETQESQFQNYFREIGGNLLVHHIKNGKISPWVLYNCDSGIAAMENLTEEQVSLIMQWIDPQFWQKKLRDYAADTEFTKHILETAGL